MPLAMGRICSCHGFDGVGRVMFADGTMVFQQFCYDCRLPRQERIYIKKDEVKKHYSSFWKMEVKDITDEDLMERVPLFQDNRGGNGECEYKGCTSNETQYHHYGFKRIFGEEANNFHIGPLCKKHHDYFHAKVDDYWEDYFSIKAERDKAILELQSLLSPKVGG